MSTKNGKIYLYILLVLGLILAAGVFNINYYKIELYVNSKPSDDGAIIVKRCYSLNSNLTCYQKNPVSGTYVKAVTYFKSEKVSESEWEVVGG
ncbi:MAG: hypothetical protein QXY45_01450 [Candidatus Aenigmatarchaeota archaeon]